MSSNGSARKKRFGYIEHVPFEGGATLAMLLPVFVQGQPLALAIGGAVTRFRNNFDQYLNALQCAVRSVSVDPDFDTPVSIEL